MVGHRRRHRREDKIITKGVPTVFADTDDDHNNLVPPPTPPLGWSKDGSVGAAHRRLGHLEGADDAGGAAVNLTVDGKKNQIRYQRMYAFDARRRRGGGGRGGRGGGGAPARESTSRSRCTSGRTASGRRRKASSKVDPNKPGAQRSCSPTRSSRSRRRATRTSFVYTQQTSSTTRTTTSPTRTSSAARQLTDANPQQKDFAWSSGVKLINYTSAKGDKLQGAMYLPANYEPGKKYPMLVTIYEKRSQPRERVRHVRARRARRTAASTRAAATPCSIRTSSIASTIPACRRCGASCPAVKAAIATGIVDPANVGLWGHSWGGYQTAFLVTQTNIF